MKNIFKVIKGRLIIGIKIRICRAFGYQSIHFLHIGKTGGTAIDHALKDYTEKHSGSICNFITKLKKSKNSDTTFIIFIYPHYIRLSDIPEGEPVIFVLREPTSRYVSGFNGRNKMDKPTHYAPWTNAERAAFAHYKSANQLAEELDSSDKEKRMRSHTAMNSIIHVKSSYYDWFKSKHYFEKRFADIFFIALQESLDSDFSMLIKKLGLPNSIELPKSPKHAHRNTDENNKTLTPAAKNNLNKWYQNEIDFYNYCKRKRGQASTSQKSPK